MRTDHGELWDCHLPFSVCSVVITPPRRTRCNRDVAAAHGVRGPRMRHSSNPGRSLKTANGRQWTRINENAQAKASSLSEAGWNHPDIHQNLEIFAFISVHSRLKSPPQGMKWQHKSHKEIEGLRSGKFQHPGLFNHWRSCWLRFASLRSKTPFGVRYR